MSRIIILDSGPLSNSVVRPPRPNKIPTPSQLCGEWIRECELAGCTLFVPAIAYYESLREIERRRATSQRERLRDFVFDVPDRLIPLSTEILEDAASLWGEVRRAGRPTSANASLDADLILVAQIRALGLSHSDYVVASSNLGHIGRFVPCEEWTNIQP